MNMATVRFDATVDFDSAALETELQAAIDTMGPQDVYGVHVPADGNDCEQGELISAFDTATREVVLGDWFVVGRSAEDLAAKLRECLAR